VAMMEQDTQVGAGQPVLARARRLGRRHRGLLAPGRVSGPRST
jgi:hypothetical protein